MQNFIAFHTNYVFKCWYFSNVSNILQTKDSNNKVKRFYNGIIFIKFPESKILFSINSWMKNWKLVNWEINN